MAKQKRKWIAGAIEHEGALTKKAQGAGMTIQQYCAQGDLSLQSTRQCNLAKTLSKMPHRGRKPKGK